MFKLSIFLVKTFSFEFKETIEMYWREIGELYIFCMIVFKIKNMPSSEISVSQDKSKVDIKKIYLHLEGSKVFVGRNVAFIHVEAVAKRCSVKKVSMEISQNSQEITCDRVSFLIKLQTLLKKRPWYKCFPVKFTHFLRAHFFTEHLWWLLLYMDRRAISSAIPKGIS